MATSETEYRTDGPNCDEGVVDINPLNMHASAIPDSVTNALLDGFIVMDSVLVSTQLSLATNATPHWRGITVQRQAGSISIPTVYDHDTPQTYVIQGVARVRAGGALAKGIPICSDGTARARLFVAGVDNALSFIGTTSSVAGAAGDFVEVTVLGGH